MPSKIKDRFPFFKNHPSVVYLDSASTSQRVDSAVLAEQEYYFEFNANVHRSLYPLAEEATMQYERVREIAKRFVRAGKAHEVIFTRGTTEALNIVAHCWGNTALKKGDEVVLSVLEHHSNLVPWQMLAKRSGAVLKFCPILSTGNLDYKALEKMVSKKTKLISMTGLSNTLGTLVDLPFLARLAKKTGAKLCIDAAQLAAHMPLDVQKFDIDFLAFSSHKIYGPTGAGVLVAKRELLEKMEPWQGGGDMIREVHLEHSTWNDVPWKFEAGTPNIAQVIGMGAAMEFMMEIGKNALMKHDRELQEYCFKKLNELPFVVSYGPRNFDQHRGSVSFTVKGVHPHDVAAILGEEGVCVRAGHHCTMPLMKVLKLPSTVRVSFGLYNTKEDIDALSSALKKVVKVFLL